MPQLHHPLREAFAQARACGENAMAASLTAGFLPDTGASPGRIDARADVKARIAELRVRHDGLGKANLEDTILAMLDLATRGEQTSAAALREARAARLEAYRLNAELAEQRETDAWTPPRPMTEAEWTAKYGPDAPTSA